MRNRILAAIAAVAIMAGITTIPAYGAWDWSGSKTAPTVSQTAQAGTPWTGKKFLTKYFCLENTIGTNWPIATAATYFKNGTLTVIPTARGVAYGGHCSDSFAREDTVVVGTYGGASNGACWAIDGLDVGPNGTYIGAPVIAMNRNACQGSNQIKNREISRAIAEVLGLAHFWSATSFRASIQNWDIYSYNWAGSDDRNSLYSLY